MMHNAETRTQSRYEKYLAAANYIRSLVADLPKTALVIGSAMTTFVDEMQLELCIKYRDIPFFPVSTVSYQKGELLFGRIGEKKLLVMNGRFHYYEGYDMSQTAFYVYVFKLLGIEQIIITNAAGGITTEYKIGDFVLIEDHIKLCAESPLRGENIAEFGERFFDMQSVYDKALADLARRKAESLGILLKSGVYAFMGGPQYETPSEIRMLRLLGATLVGMSTVPEVIACAHCKIKVLAISTVCNYAAGMTKNEVTSQEVEVMGAAVSPLFGSLLREILNEI